MFTGIVETTGQVTDIRPDATNLIFTIKSNISHELHVDQSVSHNGVCLTVTETGNGWHKVTAVAETLNKTSLKQWTSGTRVNLERCLKADGRFDGHIVQGHVDCTGVVQSISDLNGSWKIEVRYSEAAGMTVGKGSICMDGISLTVVDSDRGFFSVVIIPYTWENTGLNQLKAGNEVNLEFDIVGKYIREMARLYPA